MARKHTRKVNRPHRTLGPKRLHLGTPPGALIDLPGAEPPRIVAMSYREDAYLERQLDSLQEARGLMEEWPVLWVDVEGTRWAPFMREAGEVFGFHRLALEDVLHGHQTPKVEPYKDFIFFVMTEAVQANPLLTRSLYVFLREGLVLTFHEESSKAVETIRDHVRVPRGRVRAMDADFLCYALMDAAVDFYYPIMDQYSESIEVLEEAVLDSASMDIATAIHNMKQELIVIRRQVAPLRESINTLIRDGHPLFSDQTRLFMRDCHDHMVHVLEFVESYRELLGSLLDLYLSAASIRMNDVMRVLTVISTLFIPLTFLAGLYGMNFDATASPWNMPELHSYWGYPLLLLVLGGISAAQLIFFWRKGWIGQERWRERQHRSREVLREDDPRERRNQ